MIDLLEARRVLELTLAEYAAVRTVYYQSIYDNVDGYLMSNDTVISHRKVMNSAIQTAYTVTAGIAWKDGNGDFIIGVAGVAALMQATIQKEQGYTDALFERLKLLRSQLQDGDVATRHFTALKEANDRAEGYSKSLDYWYALVKLMALGDTELLFSGHSGTESCPECMSLLNTWHKASWYVANGYVPPRGENLTCSDGGKCEHVLMNRQGQLVTI